MNTVLRLRSFVTVLSGALALYIATFACWWIRSPASTQSLGEKQVRKVEFRFNALSWHTRWAWSPCFWFMEHIIGYAPVGFAPMEERSVMEFVK